MYPPQNHPQRGWLWRGVGEVICRTWELITCRTWELFTCRTWEPHYSRGEVTGRTWEEVYLGPRRRTRAKWSCASCWFRVWASGFRV